MSNHGFRLRVLLGHDALVEHGAAPIVVGALEPGTQQQGLSGSERRVDFETAAAVQRAQQRVGELAQRLGREG
jgi:hypothetical protein